MRLLILISLLSAVASFSPLAQGNYFGVSKKVSQSRLFQLPVDYSIAGKSFQIEEMEDQEDCTTEVILNPDLSVTVLETNGPPFVKAVASWKKEDDGTFEMEMQRFYEAGAESKASSDMGPFSFSTIRKFQGQMSKIGAKVGIEGAILDGLNEEKKVGYFEMIDTTVGEEGEEGLKMKTPESSASS